MIVRTLVDLQETKGDVRTAQWSSRRFLHRDRHRLRARTRMRLICAFTPALAGGEVHGADGSYPAG
jgi:hypothetical protein